MSYLILTFVAKAHLDMTLKEQCSSCVLPHLLLSLLNAVAMLSSSGNRHQQNSPSALPRAVLLEAAKLHALQVICERVSG